MSERTNKRERGGGKAQVCFSIGPSTFTFCFIGRELKRVVFFFSSSSSTSLERPHSSIVVGPMRVWFSVKHCIRFRPVLLFALGKRFLC